MRTKSYTPLHRVNVPLNAASIGRLAALRTDTEAASDSEVIRYALSIYAGIREADREKMEFHVYDKDGNKIDGADSKQPMIEDAAIVARRNTFLPKGRYELMHKLAQDLRMSVHAVIHDALEAYSILVGHKLAGNTCLFVHPQTAERVCLYVPASRVRTGTPRPPSGKTDVNPLSAVTAFPVRSGSSRPSGKHALRDLAA